jgi:transcriptional regulator with XRE-family HTH domain
MDCSKVGNLIYTLRTEKGMTQKALANAMNISDRTISKWERGAGCPDVSLLRELSDILGVNIEKILLGDLEPNKKDGGNMNQILCMPCLRKCNIQHRHGGNLLLRQEIKCPESQARGPFPQRVCKSSGRRLLHHSGT